MKELKGFRKEYEDHIGKIVIGDDHSLYVYLGTFEDEADADDWDAYYKLVNAKGSVIYSTCVGGVIPLHGSISDDDYEGIKTSFKLNLKFISSAIDMEDSKSRLTEDFLKQAKEARIVLENHFDGD